MTKYLKTVCRKVEDRARKWLGREVAMMLTADWFKEALLEAFRDLGISIGHCPKCKNTWFTTPKQWEEFYAPEAKYHICSIANCGGENQRLC